MLPASRRLNAAQVREVLARGRILRSGNIAVKWIAAPSFKAAAVVSKKVAKSAVARNTLRRAVYQALSPTKLPPVHAAFFVQKNVESKEVAQDILTLCSKLI
jgi:RNase P protein component